MIPVDALTLLFLLEFGVLCMIASFALYFRNRKHKLLYRRILRDMMNLKAATPEKPAHLPTPPAAKEEKSAADAKLTHALQEKTLLEKKVHELEAKLKEENKLLLDLQKKHATLENEYSILYGKHFDGKGQPDIG